MQLNLCPGCDGFVRNEWANCATCGHALGSTETNIESPPINDEKIQVIGRHFDQEAAEAIQNDSWGSGFADGDGNGNGNGWGATQMLDRSSASWSTTASGSIQTAPGQATSGPRAPTGLAAPGQRPINFTKSTRTISVSRNAWIVIIISIALVSLVIATNVVLVARDLVLRAATGTNSATNLDSPGVPADSWITYTDPAGRFMIELPTDPAAQNSKQDVSLRSDLPGSQSSVVMKVASVDLSHMTAESGLKQALDVDAAATGTVVSSSFPSDVSGRQQLDAHMTSTDKLRTVDARYFYSGQSLYSVYVLTQAPGGDPSTFSRVTRTLTVLK